MRAGCSKGVHVQNSHKEINNKSMAAIEKPW
jgi:hypothetical protein